MKLVSINTIGLTGAEMLAADLARFPEILMLPGQNFIGFGTRTYRPHDYSGWDADAVFANLAKSHTTRAGRVWAGLTKSMSPAMLDRYDANRHRAEFVALAPTATTTLDHFENFTSAFAHAGGDDRVYERFGFFGFNIVFSADHYPDFLDRSVVLDFVNPIDFWLANLGQRAVWNNLQAMRFWLVNMLVVRRWAARHPQHYLAVNVRDFVADHEGQVAKVADFLGMPVPTGQVPDGFLSYSPVVVQATERIADDVRAIYSGWAEFELASTFDDWADEFLSLAGVDPLLDRFEKFWNTTSHTNLDWVGPVADEIVEKLVIFSGATNAANTSRWFYHDCFQLNSDDWKNPRGTLEHYLGFLEDEIVLPSMAAHVRIVICYLERVADNITKRAYSALPIRQTSLYRRLLEQRGNFARWDMTDKFTELEDRIDDADAAMEKFF